MFPEGKSSDIDLVGILETLGLSSREARAYLGLARSGQLTAAQLAKKVKIARSETYEVLRSLETKGFVHQLLGKPTKFEPVNPFELRTMILQNERKRYASLEAGMSKILEIWPYLRAINLPENQIPRVATIKGRKKIASVVEMMMNKAEETVNIFTTRRGLMTAMEYNFAEISDGLIKRGVDVKMILNESSVKNISPKLLPENLDIKIGKGPKARFYLVDNRDLLYHLHLQSEDNIWGSDEAALWTDSPDQVNIYRWLFKNEWEKGIPLRNALLIPKHVQKRGRS
ncbi:MAG: TrmB family transcriptional regulator [Candidatus Hodarchaeota archaeon]